MRQLLAFAVLCCASALAQSNTYNPTPLPDSPSSLYLSTYTMGLFDTSPFSGTGTNTPTAQYNKDALAASLRAKTPLDSSGNACARPYASGCHIGVVSLGMSISGRDNCYGSANGTLASNCVAESMICQSVGNQATSPDTYGCPSAQLTSCSQSNTGGNILVRHDCNIGNQPILVWVNCAFESQQLEQWQANTQSNYTNCDTQLSNHGLTPQQVEVVWFLDVDTQPGGSTYNYPAACCDMQHLINGADSNNPGDTTCDSRDYAGTNYPYPSNPALKNSTQIDFCMYLVNMGIISRFIKTQRYPNTQLIVWNTINTTAWSNPSVSACNPGPCIAQPEPFAYETAFGIKNGIMAQQKQKAGGYSSPAYELQTLDVNYDCGGAPCVLSTNTTCQCTSANCPTLNAAWPCSPMWIWGTYEWAPGCPGEAGANPGGHRADGFCWNYADFTTEGVHPNTLGTSSDAGIMKVVTDPAGGALTGGSYGLIANRYALGWFLAASHWYGSGLSWATGSWSSSHSWSGSNSWSN